MTVRFERVSYNNPIARQFLQSAIDKPPKSRHTLEEMLSGGDVYMAIDGDEFVGAFYVDIIPMAVGNAMNIPALGGKRLDVWQDDFREFVKELMNRNGINDLYLLTKKGWGKIFPELAELGTLYLFRLSDENP